MRWPASPSIRACWAASNRWPTVAIRRAFLRRHVHDEYQNYERGSSVSERQQFVGELTGERRGELVEVRVKNRFAVGDGLELMTPQGNLRFTLEQLQNAQGQAQSVAPGDGHVLYLPLPAQVQLEYGLLMRDL